MLNKTLNSFTKLMPLWVIIAGVIGFLKPEIYLPTKPYTEWLFSFTMLGIGAVLNFNEFKPVFKKPQLVLLGTITQFTVMPLAGYLIAKLLNLSDALTIGMIVTGSVPGAMASNVISYIAKADVAYSIALTTTSTFLAPILTPIFIYIFARHLIEIPFLKMIISILKMVILPLFAGMFLKHIFKNQIEKLKNFFTAFSTFFIAFICGLIVALNKNYLLTTTLYIFLGIFLHNLTGLIAGYNLGKVYRFDLKRKRTLSIEVGMQNAGMGAVLSLKFFSNQTALVSALFATWCVITASFLARLWRKNNSST